MAELAKAPEMLAGAHAVLGIVRFFTGQFPSAREHFELAVDLFGTAPSRNYVAFFAQYAPSILVGVLVILGYPLTAADRAHELMAAAGRSSDPYSIANALVGDLTHRLFLRDTRMVAERADEMLSIATEHGMAFHLILATFMRGWALVAAGRSEEGIGEMSRSVSNPIFAEALVTSTLLVTLVETYGKNGRAEEGLDLVAKGLAAAEETALRVAEAELYRLKGELLMIKDPGNVAEAERCLRTAIDVARRQGARLFELRATVSLARLLRDTNRREEARTMLTEIYNWFTEGFDLPDLKEAKALLDELGR
jgi:predicted ATPase